MGCLDGLVVIDLSHRDDAAAYCTMVLADFGADVIKVDQPRRVGNKADEAAFAAREERLAAYLTFDRGKRSIVLDLEGESGRENFIRLARRSDVLVECAPPGTMNSLGIGYAALSEANPRLVYCAITPFGSDGPMATIPAHDLNVMALSGAVSLTGPSDGAPVLPERFVSAIAAGGNHAVIGILMAVTARQRTGRGQFVDISCLDGLLNLMPNDTIDYFITGEVPRRGETRLTGKAPWGHIYRCKDGKYIALGAGESVLWRNLCAGLDREDLLRFREPSDPDRNKRGLSELAAVFATRTRDEWFAYFMDKDTALTPVYDIDEIFRDPQVLHRQMLVELDHPTLGRIKHAGIAIKLSDTPGEIRFPGVPTGTDTRAVLEGLGWGY